MVRGPRVTDDGVRSLAAHTALTRLSLARTVFTDAGAVALCGLSNLTQLSLSRCYEVGGDQALAALAALPALTSLDLSYCPKVRTLATHIQTRAEIPERQSCC